MAIHIIGETPSTADEDVLPFPELDLPRPTSVPAATPVHTLDEAIELLGHESALIRAFAVRRIERFDDDRRLEALTAVVSDPSPAVARSAIDILAEARHAPAADAIAKVFDAAEGELAAEAAIALGRLDPERLITEVKARKRLDDYSYAITSMQLARSETEAAQAYLSKAMDRSKAMSPGRRISLFTGALLAGDAALSGRVLNVALSEETDGDDVTFPARVALAAAAGLPASMAAKTASKALLRGLSSEAKEAAEELDTTELRRAMDENDPARAISGLAYLLERPISDRVGDVIAAAARRCRSLLQAIVARVDKVEALGVEGGALFVAAAYDAAAVVHAGTYDDLDGPGLAAIAEAMEQEDARDVLLSGDADTLRKAFEGRSPRAIRRIVNTLAHQPLRETSRREGVVTALLEAGFGGDLLDAASEEKGELLRQAVLTAFPKSVEAAEAAVVEALERRPLETNVTDLALTIGGQLATERVSLAVGRRFLDLRAVSRFRLTNAALRVGDARLAPALKARAFADEPEEVAWVVLSLLANEPFEGRLAEIAQRIEADDRSKQDGLRVPLRCTRCREELTYTFEQVFVDPASPDQHGDPAFAGDLTCKACGADEKLEPNETCIRILNEEMIAFFMASQRGETVEMPRVVPRSTMVRGKETGLSAGLRLADEEVGRSPDSIRARLLRGRMRLTLRRSNAAEDIEKALEIDPNSPEARYLMAGVKGQKNDSDGAMTDLVSALEMVRGEEEPRLYEETRETLWSLVALNILALEDAGVEVPEGVDLTQARKMRQIVENQRQQELAQRQAARQGDAHPTVDGGPNPLAQPAPVDFSKAKRNDPCPCGSGKKFKKCHGRS